MIPVIAFIPDASPLHYTVQLKSGGPPMHVYGTHGELLHCWWWRCDGVIAEAYLPRACLRLVGWRR